MIALLHELCAVRYWEADEKDDLDENIDFKFRRSYPAPGHLPRGIAFAPARGIVAAEDLRSNDERTCDSPGPCP